MTMKLRLCMQAITTLHPEDTDALGDKIAAYRTAGMDDRQSERAAVADLIAQAEARFKTLGGLLREQHPDLFVAANEPAKPETALPAADSATAVAQQDEANDRDSFTLQRMNRETGDMEPVTFARGEWVRVALIGSDKSDTGEIDGISHARREVSVNGLWHPFGAAYKAERPEPVKQANTEPLSKTIERANKKHGAGLTDADKVPPPTKTPTIDAHTELFKSVRAGTATPEDFKAMYARVRDGKEAIIAELNTSTKDELLKGTSGYLRPGTTKGELVDLIYKGLLSRFALGKDYGPQSFFMGQEKAYNKAKQDALDALVEGQTAESLAEYAAEAKAEFDAEIARRTALVASVENPQTLEDFQRFMRLHTSEGKTYQEARMMLTPEQRATFDDLASTQTRSKRTTTTDDQRTQVRVAGQTVDGQIIATKHTKKGHDLYVVKLAERVSREDYDTLNAGAKRIGGYYSSFRGGGAIPGFQFTTREQAQAFVTLAGGDNTAAVEAAKERRDAYSDDRSQTAAERLTEMADAMDESASESLGRERQANTARRARFAASAESAAREAKAMAKTMRNVAKALTDGAAKFLDRIRTKTQVELLQTYVANAKYEELRAKYPTYAEQEKRKGQPPTAETADYAEFPTFTAYRSDLASLGRQLLEEDGTKKLGQQLMKVADDVSDAFMAFAKEPGNLFKLSAFGIRRGEDMRTAIIPDREAAERAIKRSGLSGKAIVFPEKRGVNRIIMSPSEAIARGIWQGDGDKRITLSAEFGTELVEKMGRANRRGARIAVPWQFERAHERRKQLARMGIETPAEFRSALREFIGLREQAEEADKIKAMERAMVGRRNDGLDFFPTPESVADEMIAAADLKPEMSVLEPSAGMGHIADRIRAAGAEPDVVEISGDRRELLQEKGYYVHPYNDFLQMELRGFFTFGDVMRAPDGKEGIMHGGPGWSGRASLHEVNADGTEGRMLGWYDRDELVGVKHRGFRGNDAGGYDRIIMNPPFSEGRDIQHVRHAYDLLKPGGRLVALMGESAFTNQNKRATEFRDWLESVGGTDEKLAEGTFNDTSLPVNTGANARMVVIEKTDDAGNVAIHEPTPAYGLANTESQAYDVAEPDSNGYETDLFGDPIPAPKRSDRKAQPANAGLRGNVQPEPAVPGDTPAPAGEYHTRTVVGVTAQRKLGASVIKTAADAAAATRYLYKSAVERLDGIVTDKDGKPLAVIGGFKGGIAEAAVYPGTMIGEAVRIPGAAFVWFSHNHPSGMAVLSRADEALAINLNDAFRGSGVEPKGLMVVAGDRFAHSDTLATESIPTSNGEATVPVIERELVPGGQQAFAAIDSPATAKQAARAYYAQAGVPGMILTDSQLKIVAWVPLPGSTKGKLRGTGGLNAIYRAVSEANAGGAILVHGGEFDTMPLVEGLIGVTQNIGAALKKLDVKPLDVINAKTGESYAEQGRLLSAGPVLSRPAPFYSALAKSIEASPMNAGQAGAWKQALKGMVSSGKVKADEVAWTGIEEWMDLQPGKITKAQIAEFLKNDGVRVEETVLGGKRDAKNTREMEDALVARAEQLQIDGNDAHTLDMLVRGEPADRVYRQMRNDIGMIPNEFARDIQEWYSALVDSGDSHITKYGQYTLPGGTNYRELLLTLPVKTPKVYRLSAAGGPVAELPDVADFATRDEAQAELDRRQAAQPHLFHSMMEFDRLARDGGPYRSNHWDQPNVLAHIRLNDRVDAEGRRVLFVEELQSDWQQAARKRGINHPPTEEQRVEMDAIQAKISAGTATIADRSRYTELAGRSDGVPSAPYIDATDKWVALALKRVIKMAVDEGYDRVAFVTGEQSAERYDLSKQIQAIDWIRRKDGTYDIAAFPLGGGQAINKDRLSAGEVADMIGKDLAERITKEKGEPLPLDWAESTGTLKGLDLKVGGSGMKSFYDKIIPAVAKDVLRKVGGGVLGVVQIGKTFEQYIASRGIEDRGGKLFAHGAQLNRDAVVRQYAEESPHGPLTQTGFDITPSMREKVAAGLPLFKRSGMEPGQMTTLAKTLAAGLNSDITVLASPFDLTGDERRQMLRLDPNGMAEGVFFPDTGRTYLFSNNVHSAEAVLRVTLHESFHRGLHVVMGEEGAAMLRRIHATNKRVRDLAAAQMEAHGIDQLTAINEALAELAGSGEATRLNLWQQLVRMVREFVTGLAKLAGVEMEWTDARVLDLVARMTKAGLRGEPSVSMGGEMAMASRTPDQTKTEAFRKWFGDSKVVDADGRPLVVYHGTRGDFNVFHTLSPNGEQRHYFASDAKTAAEYSNDHTGRPGEGANEMPVYLAIARPVIVSAGGANWTGIELAGVPQSIRAALPPEVVRRGYTTVSTIARVAEQQGHDGLIVRDVRDGAGPYGEQNPGDIYVVFRPEQIKSAIGNSGQFDPTNPNILLSRPSIEQREATDLINAATDEGALTTTGEKQKIVGSYKGRVERALKRVDHAINGLGELPDSEQFLAQRYRALGRIAEVDKVAGGVRDVFGKADREDKAAIYAYLTDRDGDPATIRADRVREVAVGVKAYINKVGDALVERGLLSEESREEYRDRYLPRMYLAHLLNEGDWRAIGAGKKVSDMGYLKQRKDIPQEIRDVLLGEVKDPTFLAATALAKPMRDMALLDWLEQISQNQAWIFPKSLVKWNDRKVSAFWLKAEADALRQRARLYPEEVNRDKAMAVAEQMDVTAAEALNGLDLNHKDYRQIPNTARYGRLRGMLVRREIYDDLMGAQDFMPKDPGWAEQVLGYGGYGTKLTQVWKMSKVALNIPGQIRNAVSNAVLLQLSGVPLHKMPILMARALSQVRNGGVHWKVAQKYGVTESTFQAQEMFRARRDLLDLEREMKGMTPWVAIKSLGAAVADMAGDAYQFTEAIFKTVKIMDGMEREGLSEEAAAIEAQKWLFDYSLLDKNIRYLRNAPVGAPFVTFTTKVLPRLAETALLHPQRFLPWVALMYGAQMWAQAVFGGDDDEWERLKKALPKWMQEKGHIAFLPWRDDAGRLQALDMSYYLPWSQWAELAHSVVNADFAGAMRNLGIFGGPVTEIITALKTGKDSFTKRDIVNEGDPPAAQAKAYIAYAWDLMMPPMMASTGVVSPMWLLGPEYGGKLAQAATGSTNRYGDERATFGQAAARLFGANVYGIDPTVTREQNLVQMKADTLKVQTRLRSKLRDRGVTPERAAQIIKDYNEETQARAKKLAEYEAVSRVPEFAKKVRERQ